MSFMCFQGDRTNTRIFPFSGSDHSEYLKVFMESLNPELASFHSITTNTVFLPPIQLQLGARFSWAVCLWAIKLKLKKNYNKG